MNNQRYPQEFREKSVRQVLERGYTVKEVSERLGVYPPFAKVRSSGKEHC